MERVLTRATRAEQFVSSDIDPTDRTRVMCDGTHLPVRDESFDVVAAFEVLAHVPHVDALLRETVRVMKRGGCAVFSVPFMYGRNDFADYWRFTQQGFAELISRSGLTLVAVEPQGGTFSSVVSMMNRFARDPILGAASGWRARTRTRELRVLLAMLVDLPFVPLTWIAFAVDRLIDKNSANALGFVFIAELKR
jgi:SAM-dependent methyltransferase